MSWNWEHKNWPDFRYDADAINPFEEKFIKQSNILFGVCKHLDEDGLNSIKVDIISEEALKTSEIEGEYLDRDSIQSSVRRHFKLQADRSRIRPAEHGIAEMMINLYDTWNETLSHNMLWRWYNMLCEGRHDIEQIGNYRQYKEPMRVVSGSIHNPKIHFEAPPSSVIRNEMNRFIDWFNITSTNPVRSIPALTHAGIAHLYFVSIHPFEDGNGRIARALAGKSLSLAIGHPTLIALSQTISRKRKNYYAALEKNNKGIEITDWIIYFANIAIESQHRTMELIEFIIAKSKFLIRFKSILNPRQIKVITRMSREGPDGFRGGLSAANYLSITGTSSATATRDLKDLVDKGALKRTGELKTARYHLNLEGIL